MTLDELKSRLDYDPDTGIFTSRGAYRHGKRVGYLDDNGYVRIKVSPNGYERAHRLAWLFVHGHLPVGEIDHIDGDRANNRIINLRDVTKMENQHNRCAPKRDARTAKVIGVSWYKPTQKWCAQIQVAKKKIHLGYHDTIEEAHTAYIKAKHELHPTHMRLR